MAIGPTLRSSFAFMRGRGVGDNTFMLRKEVEQPVASRFSWINFWFGTDYSGTAKTASLSDTVGGSGFFIQ